MYIIRLSLEKLVELDHKAPLVEMEQTDLMELKDLRAHKVTKEMMDLLEM